MARWYNPATKEWHDGPQPANDATARHILSGRMKALRVYEYLRGPAYRMDPQLAFRSTWEHFREEDAGRLSPISLEVEDFEEE